MNKINFNAIISGIQEWLRIVIIGVSSYLLMEGVLQALLTKFFSTRLDSTQIVFLTGLLLSAVKGVDKWANKRNIDTPLDLKVMDSLKK